RRAELVERQRLQVPFDVGGGLARIAPGKGAELGRRHRQQTRAVQRVLESHRCLAEQAVRALVQGADVLDLVDDAYLQVVVQVLAHARQIMLDFDAVLLQQGRRTNAG